MPAILPDASASGLQSAGGQRAAGDGQRRAPPSPARSRRSTSTSIARLRMASRPIRSVGSSIRSAAATSSAPPSSTAPSRQCWVSTRAMPTPAMASTSDQRGVHRQPGAQLGHRDYRSSRPQPARRPRPRWSAASPWSSGRPRRASGRAARPPRRPPGRRRRPARASVRVTPTSSTAAPGRTMSAVISPRTPAAATTTSARRTSAARSRVPVWQSVTVAFSLRRVSSRPERPADGDPAADHGDPGPVQRHAVAPAQLDDARAACTAAARARRAPAGRGSPGAARRRPWPGRRAPARRPASSPRGSGSCTMKPVHAGSAFSSSMARSTSAWVASAGSSRCSEAIPTLAQSRCLPRT